LLCFSLRRPLRLAAMAACAMAWLLLYPLALQLRTLARAAAGRHVIPAAGRST
jgi:hypothetical protein